jgi:hypothetical protein
MYRTLLLILLAATTAFGQAQRRQTVPATQQFTKPQTPSFTGPAPHTQPTIPKKAEPTTTGLSPDSALNIGIELGTQGETMGELKEKVDNLQDQRERVDRPDIDSLKATRSTESIWMYVLSTVVGTVLAIVWFLRKFLWKAAVPYLRKEIIDSEAVPVSSEGEEASV